MGSAEVVLFSSSCAPTAKAKADITRIKCLLDAKRVKYAEVRTACVCLPPGGCWAAVQNKLIVANTRDSCSSGRHPCTTGHIGGACPSERRALGEVQLRLPPPCRPPRLLRPANRRLLCLLPPFPSAPPPVRPGHGAAPARSHAGRQRRPDSSPAAARQRPLRGGRRRPSGAAGCCCWVL